MIFGELLERYPKAAAFCGGYTPLCTTLCRAFGPRPDSRAWADWEVAHLRYAVLQQALWQALRPGRRFVDELMSAAWLEAPLLGQVMVHLPEHDVTVVVMVPVEICEELDQAELASAI